MVVWSRHRRPSLSGWLASVALVMLSLTGCQQSVTGGARPSVAVTAPRPVLLADGTLYEAAERPGPSELPSLVEAEARRRAAGYVVGAPGDSKVVARYVTLTVTSPEGAQPVAARPVWLVTYVGVPFVSQGCACHDLPDRANTVVVLDGSDGALVLLYGVGDG